MSDSFVHLHVHNEYSMLDGAAQIEPTMKHVAEVLHQPAIASTNHGFLFDTYEFMSAAKNHGVKPIVGLEAYIAPESRFTRSKMPFKGVEGTEDNYSHMTMLAENNEGLHNLFRLSTLASYEGFYHKPRMDRELLSQYASGLIATTGCLGGEVNQLLLRGKRAEALEAAGEFRDIFGADNFFFEVMDHGIPEERAIRQDQLAIAEKLGLPLLATNDSHYLHAEQKDSHQALLCVQSGSTLEDPKMVFSGEGYHIKSSEEMRTLWRDYKSACDNTLLVAERCDVSLDPRDDLFPDFPVPPGYTFGDYLSEQTWKGLRERVGSISPELEARTKYELEIILNKNYAGYFLVVSDFIRWAKSQGIMIGPGRGSGGGSVVAYGMRITDLYPLDHGLLFERFLNPERPSAPDFDIDIQDDRRQEVIDYVTKKYGAERVAMIVTYGTIKGKQAIKDSTKVLGLPISTGETLSKAYPEAIMGKEASMASALDKGVNSARYREGAKLRELAESDPNNARVLEVARGLEGLKRQWGVHAAGVVVSSHELMDVIPLMKRPSDGTIVTQFDYPTCESLGLLKMDFLGLRNLTVLSKARDNLKKTTGQDIEYTDLPLDDKKTYELLSRGETMGVFQMDGNDMRKLMRRMRPTQFENIVAVGALYRPGPMGAGSHLKYADRKNGREAVDYIHPELKEILEPILGTTFGLCVPAGTPIFDSVAGKWVPIEELQAGHSETPSLNEATGTLETKTVNHVVHTGEKKIVKITLNGGRELRVSRTHPVLTDRGYVEASDLAVNDRVRMGNESPMDAYGQYENILSVASDGVADCYDIEVADNHNFLVNGVVVHNCVYQEQVMEMGQVLADYSLGEADLLRRAMGKKKKDVVDQAKPHFMSKMKEKGFSEEAFQAVWDVIVPFSDYAFNRSHAAAYGLISYWTAYMKSHYPTEYMSALLSLSVETPVTLGVYLAETRRMGIEILPPNVNVSDYDYTPHNGSIVFGLGGIKGVSSASSEKILRDRSEEGYASLSDFFYTTGSNAAVGKALINAGAFDSFGITRAGLEAQLPNIAKMSAVRRKDETSGVYDLLSTLDVSEDGKNFRPAYDPEFPSVEWDREEVISREYEATKMYLTGHPLEGRTKALEVESTVSWFDALNVLGNREQITIGGLLKDVNIRLSKRNNLWGEMNLVGIDGTLAMRCFKGDLLESKKDAFQENNIVAVRATVVNEDDSYFLQVNNIKVVTETDADVVIPDPIVIQADKSQMTRDAVEKLQYCAKQYRGVTPVTMRVKGTNQHLTLPYHMKSDDALKRALMAIFGNDCIVSGF